MGKDHPRRRFRRRLNVRLEPDEAIAICNNFPAGLNISTLKREDGDYYRGGMIGDVGTAHISRTILSQVHELVTERASNGIGALRQQALSMNLVSANVLGSFEEP